MALLLRRSVHLCASTSDSVYVAEYRYALAYYNLGTTLMGEERYAESEFCYRECHPKLDPGAQGWAGARIKRRDFGVQTASVDGLLSWGMV